MDNTVRHIKDVFEQATLVHSDKEVSIACDKMAAEITAAMSNENPLLLCVMLGGIRLTGELLARLHFPLTLDYVHVTRYGGNIEGGILDWIVKPTSSLSERTILIIDDVLDGGLTLAEIARHCKDSGAKSVQSAVLVNKNVPRTKGGLAYANFVGLSVEDKFIFGAGMDYKDYFRNTDGIYSIKK